jgi:hypothetical protein
VKLAPLPRRAAEEVLSTLDGIATHQPENAIEVLECGGEYKRRALAIGYLYSAFVDVIEKVMRTIADGS